MIEPLLYDSTILNDTNQEAIKSDDVQRKFSQLQAFIGAVEKYSLAVTVASFLRFLQKSKEIKADSDEAEVVKRSIDDLMGQLTPDTLQSIW